MDAGCCGPASMGSWLLRTHPATVPRPSIWLAGRHKASAAQAVIPGSRIGPGCLSGGSRGPGRHPTTRGQGSAALDCGGSGKAVDWRNARISSVSYRLPNASRRGSIVLPDRESRPGATTVHEGGASSSAPPMAHRVCRARPIRLTHLRWRLSGRQRQGGGTGCRPGRSTGIPVSMVPAATLAEPGGVARFMASMVRRVGVDAGLVAGCRSPRVGRVRSRPLLTLWSGSVVRSAASLSRAA
jgi:hypothetical protein